MPAGAPLDRVAVIAHAANPAHDGIEIRHLERDVIEIGVVIEAEHQTMVVGIAPDKSELACLIRQPETKRSGEKTEGRVVVAAVQIHMRQFGGPIGYRKRPGVIGNIADHREIPPLRILEAEPVSPARPLKLSRRPIGQGSEPADLLVDQIDRAPSFGLQHDPDQAGIERGRRSQTDHVEIAVGCTEINDSICIRDLLKIPDVRKERPCKIQIPNGEIDTSNSGHRRLSQECLRHGEAML
jgi:hypothetical protein